MAESPLLLAFQRSRLNYRGASSQSSVVSFLLDIFGEASYDGRFASPGSAAGASSPAGGEGIRFRLSNAGKFMNECCGRGVVDPFLKLLREVAAIAWIRSLAAAAAAAAARLLTTHESKLYLGSLCPHPSLFAGLWFHQPPLCFFCGRGRRRRRRCLLSGAA